MDEKEAEARPVMGTIFLVPNNTIMEGNFINKSINLTFHLMRLEYQNNVRRKVGSQVESGAYLGPEGH